MSIKTESSPLPPTAPLLFRGAVVRLREIESLQNQIELQVNEYRERGREEGLQEVRELWRSFLQEAREQMAALSQAQSEAGVEIGLRIAELILGHHLETDPSIFEHLVKTAISHCGPRCLRVIVHPDQLKLLNVKGLDSSTRQPEIVGDRSVRPWGCVLEYAWGTADAGVDTQLANIRAARRCNLA